MNSSIYKTGSLKDNYKLDKVLGEGSFAVVRKGIKKTTNEEVAVKIIDKTNLESDDQYALQSEVDILSQIDHPNIVKLHEIYDEKTRFNMVMELMTGGELFDRIVEKEHYSEKEAADTIRPVVDAMRYCHSMGIAHRDLKPENLLYASTDPNSIIKITDFGLAKVINNELMTTACGTPGYVAPEILEGKGYDVAVDYWSIGVIIYVMLCGFPPFYEDSNEKLFEMIKTGTFEFPSPQWDQISDYAKDLVKKLLIVDPYKRLNADQILKHPWIVGDVTPRKNLPSVTAKIKEFNARRRLKRAQLLVLINIKWRNVVKSETN
jgi:calcium/calmodulin-dependent protein kinase I